MKQLRYITLCVGLLMAGITCVMAQVPAANIRYVKTTANGGKYTNDGRSWLNAKNNIQDAINALVAQNLLPGEVWVAEGTYVPTESTESSGGSTLYMSFKIPAGITVRGGFPADGKLKKKLPSELGQDSIDAYITSPDDRPMVGYTEVGDFPYFQTVLSGDLSAQRATFNWDSKREQYATTFYGNTYHVVTFATNGFHPDGHAKALDTSKGEAALECVIIEHGNAQFTGNAAHPHEAYGGGVYMVKGSHLITTCVRECEATRAGGGIYMDGGGIADHVYVSKCQALGIGTTYGFGGGIFMEDGTYDSSDPTKGMYPTVVRRSGVTGSVARNGGGMAIYCNNTAYKNRLAVSAMLVANNVAQNEAGGVYMYQGGALTQATVVRNKCLGSGISVNGMVNGRSGGIYARDYANVGNSVIWGNECSNRDVQYAGSRSGTEDAKKPVFRCVMLSKADYADWSGVVKFRVNDLSTDNAPAIGGAASHINYPAFKNPTPTAGYISDIYYRSLMALDNEHPAYSWKVEYSSALTNAGVQTIDLDTAGLTPATNESMDIMGKVYASHPTLGGYTSTLPSPKPYHNVGDKSMHLFVDPNAGYAVNASQIGNSWDNAIRSMSDVLFLMQMTLNAFSPTNTPADNNLEKLYIHVKEGNITNNGEYTVGRVRNNTLTIPNIPASIAGQVTIEILGGYASDLPGTDLSKRNPLKYPTVITGNIIDDYSYNTAHLVTLNGARDVTIDGFQLRNGNASSTKQENSNRNGAAFTILNSQNITIKNCLVAGCQAEQGAAVYANNSTVNFENCIFHNNTSTQKAGGTGQKPSIVHAAGKSNLTFDHCDVIRNVGYGAWLDGASAHTTWQNTIFYGNFNQPVDDTNNADVTTGQSPVLPAFGGTTANATGSYCLFDVKSDVTAINSHFTNSRFDMSYVFDGGANSNYPRFINPTKNAGISPDGDITYYGRATSYEPHNTNPMVNAASFAGDHSTWGTDISAVTTRDFGGVPDIGAIENHKNEAIDEENAYTDGQPAYGVGFYVRDYGSNYTAGGDGMSWAGAINGNAYYYGDGTHGSAPTKTMPGGETIIHYKTEYYDGARLNLPTTDGGSITVMLKNGSDYLVLNGNKLTTSRDVAAATEFTITCTRSGNWLTGYTYSYTITSGGKYLGYDGTGKNAKFTASPSNANRVWYAGGSNGNPGTVNHASFANKTDNNNKKYLVKDGINTSAVDWSFYTKASREVEDYREERGDVVEGVIGLQYAVNSAHAKFRADGGSLAQKTTVWVGEGTYTNAVGKAAGTTFTSDEIAKHLVSQPYAFEMKEGVDVIGGFPGVGNPGEQQRDPKVYETILQPQTKSPYVTMSFYCSTSADDVMQVATNDDWGSCAGTSAGNEKTSVGRVLVQPGNFAVQTMWDGFTLRHGYLFTAYLNNIGKALSSLDPHSVMPAGGAGALLQENGVLSNCKVVDNLILHYAKNANMVTTGSTYSPSGNTLMTLHIGGAGVFMTGSSKGAIVENCQIYRNELLGRAVQRNSNNDPDHVWMYGAGLYQDKGNVYNTITHDNTAAMLRTSFAPTARSDAQNNEMILGAGAFIASGNFYNNTVAKNISCTFYQRHSNHCSFAGVHVAERAYIYNSIITDNDAHWSYECYTGSSTSPGNGVPVSSFKDGAQDRDSRDASKVHVYYSYIDVDRGDANKDLVSQNDLADHVDGAGNHFYSNIYLNQNQKSTTTTNNLNPSTKILNLTTYQLLKNSPAINTATEDIRGVTIPEVDAEYKDRIMDCVIDMGAYEYNGAYDIVPTVSGNVATFYVTPKGVRLATATDPENAACADKLQKVLDAAGRYKYQNPTKQVIVKLANDYESQHPGSGEPEPFTYYANRSTNPADQDVRIWSVMVPRGVELWGGYTNLPMKMQDGKVVRDSGHGISAWSNTYNGFYSGATDLRDIVGNATYVDATYANKLEHTTATSYHTVAFTDRIFDGNGNPYLSGDNNLNQNSSYNSNTAYENEGEYKHMSDNASITDRSVLDGLFLTGGQADAPANSDAVLRNANQFGGAAIVEPYAHVRNCIVENNSATYGGALALKEKALVSGCLIRNNTATRGAGIYVFENGTQLSESGRVGRYTVNTAQGGAATMDANMPHIFLSTIVRNEASNQGGGLWFTNSEANVRVNSSVLWRNEAQDQGNVSGAYSPVKPASDATSTVEFYPFAYSAVQNLRLSGTNNVLLQPSNKNGARFAFTNASGVEDDTKMADTEETGFTDFGYYGLTAMSAMVRTGMSVQEFDALRTQYGLAASDFMAVDRKVNEINAPERTYVEIGARALEKSFTTKQLMLRLFVAQPEDVDADVAQAMQSLGVGATSGSPEEYYSQEGSSFAYPFQSLQDALDYIYLMRSTKNYKNGLTYVDYFHANDLPFEIMIAKGTYHPTRDIDGNYGESLANTFAIPEGVSLYGGFEVNARAGKWYGRYVKPKAGSFVQKPNTPSTWVYSTANVDTIPTGTLPTPPGSTAPVQNLPGNEVQLTVDAKTYTIVQASAINMTAFRAQIDVNNNNIIEPWEFKNQTILSGNATSADGQGVYHIVTICPDENVVGVLPTISGFRADAEYTAANGYLPKEYGQYVQFNGLTFTGGRAHTYSSELDEMAKYNYYHGGAVLLDGNRYNNNYNDSVAAHQGGSWVHKATEYKHTGRTNAVGYRDIMTTFANCRFFDNEAGYGGAISANTELELFSSAFEANIASYSADKVTNSDNTGKIDVTFAGQGGAVFSTYSLSAFNTLFANNEARDLTHTNLTSGTYYSYRNWDKGGSHELPGTGGAIYSGLHSSTHMFNCDVVRNMANSYPGVFTMNPNTYDGNPIPAGAAAYNQIANTVFWGNEVNASVKSANRSNPKLFAAQLAINYGAANRNPMDLMNPYDPFAGGAYPTTQAALDDAAHKDDLTQKNFSEMLYFCAYEEGRGITPTNANDFRTISPHFFVHSTYTFSHADLGEGVLPYQNSNIAISSDNDALEGPAFMRPSMAAGVDGYMESADWSPARLNNLSDNGSGKLDQQIRDVAGEKKAEFITYTSQSQLPNRSLVSSSPVNAFTTEKVGDYKGDGAYIMARYLANYPYYKNYLSVGYEHYMTTYNGDEIYRISPDPNPTHNQTFVDIGVYEYVHVPLEPETEDEVDILWVSNYEKPENGLPNGSSWLQPTSDLQRAIETLLASRNGHRKEIRLCDGTYSPIYTINGSLSFYIDTKFLNDAATGTNGQGVKSLVIKGGYSREYNGLYDVDLYPVVIKQQETATPSAKYDHLIYIKDATQRYHGAAYNAGNGYGWFNSTEKSEVYTFPIQIEGVTLINDQASALGKGAAIYYEYQHMDGKTASSTTTASVTTGKDGSGHHTYVDKTNPAKLIIANTTVLGSGAKDKSKGASAVYIGYAGGNALIYNSLFHSNFGDPLVTWNTYTVNNTFALNEGAVRLGTSSDSWAEHSKAFNNVLWRNNPKGGLKADVATSFDYQLEMDDLYHDTGATGDYAHAGKDTIFAYNAYTGGNTVDIDYDPTSGTLIKGNNHNVGLVNLNTDVTYGPNFNDPLNTDLMKRDFRISPSMRLLNKGDSTLYGDTTLNRNTHVYDLAWEVNKRYDITTSNRIAAGAIDLGAYEYQYELNRVLYVDPNKATSGDGLSWENALGFGNIQNAIDLAGVSHSNLQKSTYVFVKAASATNLNLHTGETLTLRDGVQVYGSVRSDYGVECPYTNPVLGSKERAYNDDVLEAYVGDVLLYGRFGVISPIEGHTRISGINTNGTAFTTTDNPKLKPTLIDGFEVMPKDAASASITKPVLTITPRQSDEQFATGNVQVGLRNIAVHDYKATGCNVAEVDNALLYSALFHHNTVPAANAALKIGNYGYLLHATVEGKTIGANGSAALNGGADAAAEAASHILRSIVNYTTDSATLRTLSGFTYLLEDNNMNYQLTEYSKYIDEHTNTMPGIPAKQQVFVTLDRNKYTSAEVTNIRARIQESTDQIGSIGSEPLAVSITKYKSADRDLLGNFRWQNELKSSAAGEHIGTWSANHIDRGAFETWRVETDHEVEYPNYPYPGTCEYIMSGKSLVIDPVDVAGDATASAHVPGFVLLQEGASLYGNGREIKVAYAAIERTIKNGQDLMLATPWDQNMIYNGISDPTRNAVNGLFVVEYDANGGMKTLRTDAGPVYNYDPTARADWQYRIAPADSKCWTPVMSPILPACTGVYTNLSCSNATPVKAGNATANLTIRCMGKGANMADYIYEELVASGHQQHTAKTVTLYRHDDAESTAGGGDFTDAKNTGWNFIGYPYLTSHYQPYHKDNINPATDVITHTHNPGKSDPSYSTFLAVDAPYAMDHPQTMWLYYDGVQSPDGNIVDGTGGFYSVNSWESETADWHVATPEEAVIHSGEGFFVQTNTLQPTEELVFHRPLYHGSVTPAPKRYYVKGDVNEDANEDANENYITPEQLESMKNKWEKILLDGNVYIVHRDDKGRIEKAFDVTGRAVEL